MNKKYTISQLLVTLSILGIAVAYFISHYSVLFLPENMRTFQNLFITKMNAIEMILISLFIILLAIYYKKND